MASREVGEIALYGTGQHGHGFIARAANGAMGGDGELHQHWSATDAYWYGMIELKNAGVKHGLIRVFAPGGKFAADVAIHKAWPYFGNLEWKRAPQYEISLLDLLAAEEQQRQGFTTSLTGAELALLVAAEKKGGA